MTAPSGRRAPWWCTYFDHTFLALHEPLFTETESRREVAALLDLLGLPIGSRVLDVPCGWGRHTRLLREAGFDVIGADLSPTLLRHAVRHDRSGGWTAADVRALPFGAACFDGVVDVCTSVGLFATDGDELSALRELRRVLDEHGVLLLESMHRDDVVAGFRARDAWSLPDGTEVVARRRFDPLTGSSSEVWRWRRGDERGTRRHTLRLRTATEIVSLLRRAGFTTEHVWGDWHGSAFTHRSPRMIVRARARRLASRRRMG